MTLNGNSKKNRVLTSNAHSFSDTARLLGYRKVNAIKPKENKFQNIKQVSDINWDDPIDIDIRDSDSIQSENIKKSKTKSAPKLYSFYNYIQKTKDISNIGNTKGKKNQSNLKLISPGSQLSKFENKPELIYKLKKGIDSEFELIESRLSTPDLKYSKMPISSGFGGYTTTTTLRKKNPPQNAQVIAFKKNDQLKNWMKPEEDAEPRDYKIGTKNKTVIVEPEPEEEIVHVIHKPRKNRALKEQIVYVDEDDENVNLNNFRLNQKPKAQEVIYLNRSPSPEPVIHSQRDHRPKFVYSIPKRQQHQIMYLKEPSPVQYIYKEQTQPYRYAMNEYRSQSEINQEIASPRYIYYETPQNGKRIIYSDE